MKEVKKILNANRQRVLLIAALGAGLVFLMFYKLGGLTSGISSIEVRTNNLILGWHGLYHNPLYLPLNFLRSIDFFLFKQHSAFLLRLPNAIFGLLSVLSFAGLSYLWHGKRAAYMSTIMFACSAWVLHASRLASFDVIYLWAMTSSILGYVCLSEFKESRLVWYLNFFLLGLIATIPGLFWLSIVFLVFESGLIKEQLKESGLLKKLLSFVLLIIWLPLLIYRSHINHTYKQWLGLPEHFGSVPHILKDFVAVPFHLLVRGPLYPELWLGRAPVLDAFALAMLLLGAYTYAKHRGNSRSRLLASLIILSVILIGLGGSVSFSLILPVAYLLIAMGLSYLIHSWRKVFPFNPVAKWLSLAIVVVAIALSCSYNLRSYFVAWPHNPNTYSTFDQTV